MEGQILGNRYKLLERIGGGGMAVVYKAKCLLLNRFVAVKILRSEFTDDEEFVKRFRVEAQAAASLNHPNIVSIYDVGRQDDIQYIVMEYIDGITLKDYIAQKGALPWKEAVNIAIQICSALEQAHKNFIVHRDIKPHNILITKEGIAKVTDFGIARAVTSATITMVGSTIGSVHYFSPEQARGGFIDEKSDLYSLGVTIYEMVTGRVPFDGETPVAIALKHIQERPVKPIDINPSIPKGVNDIIMKAMKKDQNLRYQNASEMLADLQNVLVEPGIRIPEGNAVEEMPTRKMQAVGAGLKIHDEIDEDMDESEFAGYTDDTDTDDTDDTDYIGMDEDEDEDEDGEVRKKKKDRLSVWLGIATGIVIVGLIILIGIKFIPTIMLQDNGTYTVEDFTNKDFEEVKDMLSQYGINAESEEEYSDTVEKGTIISQDVAAGNTLKPESTIHFVVSAGPELVEIPDMKGNEARVAELLIQNNGLIPEEVKEYSEKVGTGLVIRTEPEAHEMVKPDSVVKIYVSLGPELKKVKVPNLIGKIRMEAENEILKSGLTIGKILPEGVISDVAKVVRQYPLPDQEVDESTAVELTFAVDEQPGQPDKNQTQTQGTQETGNGSQGQGNEQNQEKNQEQEQNHDQQRTKLITITLDPNRTYGEKVMVYVESTPSDTNIRKIELNQMVDRDDFPFSLPITVGKEGTTHVIVYLDNVLALETDLDNK